MIGDAGGAGAGGMDTIGLVQIGHAGHTFQQERNERHPVLAREILKHLTKCARVLFPVVRRRFHADEQHGNASLLRAMDDRLEVVFHLARGQAAKPVVRAQRQNQQPHIALERPVRAPQAVGRRVAGDAGVDDFERRIPALSACAEAEPDTPAPGGRPSPAVRLSPSATMRGAVGRAGADGTGAAPPPAAALPTVSARPQAIAASTRRQRRTRFNPPYFTCRILASVVTIAFQPALARARAALERGRHADAIGVLTQALKSSGLKPEDELGLRCTLAEAWLMGDDVAQAAADPGTAT